MIGKKLQDHILISTDLLDCAGKTASVFRGSASFDAEFGRSAINEEPQEEQTILYFFLYKLYCTTFYTSASLVNKTREVMFHHKDYSQ